MISLAYIPNLLKLFLASSDSLFEDQYTYRSTSVGNGRTRAPGKLT